MKRLVKTTIISTKIVPMDDKEGYKLVAKLNNGKYMFLWGTDIEKLKEMQYNLTPKREVWTEQEVPDSYDYLSGFLTVTVTDDMVRDLTKPTYGMAQLAKPKDTEHDTRQPTINKKKRTMIKCSRKRNRR